MVPSVIIKPASSEATLCASAGRGVARLKIMSMSVPSRDLSGKITFLLVSTLECMPIFALTIQQVGVVVIASDLLTRTLDRVDSRMGT